MLLRLLFENPIFFLVIAAGIMIAITIHEFAHAWIADKLGDPTPRYQDRVTLDPRAHLDPIGTLTIFLVGFGWGKPVMFDPYNLKEPVRDTALIALAGPVSNIILATVLAFVYHLGLLPIIGGALPIIIQINIMLAIFNLVPVHPLDGSKILMAILPPHTAVEYEDFMRKYGMWVLLLLILPWNGASPISRLISPVMDLLLSLLGI